jgi:hypothetical protein
MGNGIWKTPMGARRVVLLGENDSHWLLVFVHDDMYTRSVLVHAPKATHTLYESKEDARRNHNQINGVSS